MSIKTKSVVYILAGACVFYALAQAVIKRRGYTPTAQGQMAPVEERSPAWFQCAEQKDCALSFGPCGEWTAVNVSSKREWEKWAIHRGAALDCPENHSAKPPVGCRAGQCVVLPKRT